MQDPTPKVQTIAMTKNIHTNKKERVLFYIFILTEIKSNFFPDNPKSW